MPICFIGLPTTTLNGKTFVFFLWPLLENLLLPFCSPLLQVWGVKGGPYEFRPAPSSSFVGMFSPLNFNTQSMEKRIEGSFVLQE